MEPAAHIRPGFVVLALRRRWRVLVAAALIGLLAGFAAASTMAVTYSSHADLILNPIAGNPYNPDVGTARNDQLVALQTESTLIGTPEVAALARTLSPVPLPEAAERNVSTTAPSNSQVLVVTYSAASPEVATAGAQSFADAYLEYRRQRAEQANLAEAEQLQTQLDATNTVIGETATALAAAAPGSSDELLLRQQLSVYSSQLAQLRLQLTEVLSAVPSTGEVLGPASQSLKPSGLPTWVIAVAGMVFGLGCALLYVLAREHGDDRIRDAQELSGLGAGHPLATVPAGPAALDLTRSSHEGYRLLLTVLTSRDPRRTPVVCVLGSEGSSSATTVAAGIAAAAHRLGRRALLVGTDVDRIWDDARVFDVERGLDPGPPGKAPAVLRLGRDTATAEETAVSSALPEALVRARHNFDLVILAGRTGSSVLGWRFAALADLTLVVGEVGHDDFTELLDAVETLRQSGVNEIGVVASTRTRGDESRAHTRSRRAARGKPEPSPLPSAANPPVTGAADAATESHTASSGGGESGRAGRRALRGANDEEPDPVDSLADRRAGR